MRSVSDGVNGIADGIALPNNPLVTEGLVHSSGQAEAHVDGEDDGGLRAAPSPEAWLTYYRSACEPAGDFGIEHSEFERYVGERAPSGTLPPLRYAPDLLLACACRRGVETAIRAFERRCGAVMQRVLQHRKARTDLADDVGQMVRERLLVGDRVRGIEPKIGLYRGSGPLEAWVASTAATTLLMARRSASRRREQAEDSPGAALANAKLHPELDYLKQRYKAEVEAALEHAIAQLDARECTLLHLHLTERLSIDVLGSMYSVNRATAARWLAAARSKLLELCRRHLRAQLELSETECDSLIALANSGLEVSIARRLSERLQP